MYTTIVYLIASSLLAIFYLTYYISHLIEYNLDITFLKNVFCYISYFILSIITVFGLLKKKSWSRLLSIFLLIASCLSTLFNSTVDIYISVSNNISFLFLAFYGTLVSVIVIIQIILILFLLNINTKHFFHNN